MNVFIITVNEFEDWYRYFLLQVKTNSEEVKKYEYIIQLVQLL